MIDPKQWIRAKRAAALSDTTQQWIRELGLRGRLRTVEVDLGTLYFLPDVEQYARERAERNEKKDAA